ncbi:MAG: hypothetical protein WCQ99_08585 [Pseudomonadota bacterium]
MNHDRHKTLPGSLLACILLLACTYTEISAQPPHEAQQSGRTQTMTEQQHSNKGKRFPEVTAASLAKTPESIPTSAQGKITLVTVAFLRESQSQLDSWLGPFAEKFAGREGFTFYEVPMISSGYKFMRMIIDGGMRAGLPESKHAHVVTMYGDVEKYITELQLDPRYGHAFLLDRQGIIRFQGQGFAKPETLQELFATAEQLAK